MGWAAAKDQSIPPRACQGEARAYWQRRRGWEVDEAVWRQHQQQQHDGDDESHSLSTLRAWRRRRWVLALGCW